MKDTAEQQPQHILVVDDDQDIRDLLGQFLQKHSYKTSLAQDGIEMFAILEKEPTVDLIILDIMLPGDDGMTLCRKLRSDSQIPIIMLTAISEEVERILGLELGADDYLSKPFNPRELLARIKAIMRRSATPSSEAIETESAILKFNDWQLDKTSRRLTSPDGLEISLSSGEYNLLVVMLERPQQVLSRDQLLDLTKNRSAGPYDRSIDIQISRLRQKLEEDPKAPQIIKTVRGGGYVIAVNVDRITQ